MESFASVRNDAGICDGTSTSRVECAVAAWMRCLFTKSFTKESVKGNTVLETQLEVVSLKRRKKVGTSQSKWGGSPSCRCLVGRASGSWPLKVKALPRTVFVGKVGGFGGLEWCRILSLDSGTLALCQQRPYTVAVLVGFATEWQDMRCNYLHFV